MSPACPPDLAPRPRRPYETASAVFAFPRVLIFAGLFLDVLARAGFTFFAVGFFLRAETFGFPAFLFLGDMFFGRLLPESIILHSRGISTAVTGNFGSRLYNADKEVRSDRAAGSLRRLGPWGVPQP